MSTITINNDLTVSSDIKLNNSIKDSSGSAGTNGYVLTSTGTGWNWAQSSGSHHMSITKNGHQNFTLNSGDGSNNIWYGGGKITNWTVLSQSSSQWSSSNNWWVCPSTGVYLIMGTVIIAGGNTNIDSSTVRLYKNDEYLTHLSWIELSRLSTDDDDITYFPLSFNYSISLNTNDTLHLHGTISSSTQNSTGTFREEGTSLTILKLS